MSTLGKKKLSELLRQKDIENRLIITPLLEETQVGDASIDLRLGNQFIITRRGNLPSIDPARTSTRRHRYQTKHHINFREKFYLHPGELVLAATLEYIRLPRTHSAIVASRSSWGRSGLVIATAICIAPGFAGSITLELVNLGEVPLVLYPGINVAQLILFDCEGADSYGGKFSCFTGPEFGDVSKDPYIDFFAPRDSHKK